MTLKVVLFDFNGVIINDEPIHERLIEQLLIQENLRINRGEFRQICLGRSDRACIAELLNRRGRTVTETYLAQLQLCKAQAYINEIKALDKLPIYPGLEDLIFKIRVAKLKMGLVTGALRKEVELVLSRAGLAQYFEVIVTSDDGVASKPQPDGYLLAVERFNQLDSTLNLQPGECLAIEDTFAGIQSAQKAGIPVVGVAHTYPFHFLQRTANWAVDYLCDLELERVQQVYSQEESQTILP
ncbi:MAG TPA: HAD family phosphatase [Kamptonema sp.]|nr:HAD family phosphatase [Kamptonema sp.]